MIVRRPLSGAALALLLSAGSVGFGCRGEPAPPPAAPAPRTAPVAPGAPAQLSVPDEVRVRLDLDAARSAIRIHQQEHGSNPPSLDSLGLKLHFPADLSYEPASGQVTSGTYPRL